jgi:hypothetical protein
MRPMFLAVLLVSATPAAAQHGEEADRAAVMATVDQLFGALAGKDRAALLGVVVAEGRATSAGVDAAGGLNAPIPARAQFGVFRM